MSGAAGRAPSAAESRSSRVRPKPARGRRLALEREEVPGWPVQLERPCAHQRLAVAHLQHLRLLPQREDAHARPRPERLVRRRLRARPGLRLRRAGSLGHRAPPAVDLLRGLGRLADGGRRLQLGQHAGHLGPGRLQLLGQGLPHAGRRLALGPSGRRLAGARPLLGRPGRRPGLLQRAALGQRRARSSSSAARACARAPPCPLMAARARSTTASGSPTRRATSSAEELPGEPRCTW